MCSRSWASLLAAIAGHGEIGRTLAAAQGYCWRINALSFAERWPFSPTEKPSVVQRAGIGYNMIESRSNCVKFVSAALYGSNILCSMTSRDQLFGGPERSRVTAARFQWMPPAG